MISFILPAYREPYLNNTIESLLKNCTDIEIIPIIDGYELKEPLPEDKRVKPIVFDKNEGMRHAVNAGIEASRGDFIAKMDAHCAVGEGFNEILEKDMQDNWLMIPRRYSLDPDKWDRRKLRDTFDYHYITYPETTSYGYWMGTAWWKHKKGPNIDDTMIFQGSCWVANKEYFKKRIGKLDEDNYGQFADEHIETDLKYWLFGGEVKVNKNTWYAHLSKRPYQYLAGMFSRRYKKNSDIVKRYTWATNHWLKNKEPGHIYSFQWLVEKFWPVPSWPENRELWKPL